MEAAMNLRKILGVISIAAAFSGCSSYGPGGIHYTTSDAEGATGATFNSGSGSISGSSTAPEKEQRGNTPVGQDRDGHGPATGAIVDPTGAATGRKPY
jgi:hypothetical protein